MFSKQKLLLTFSLQSYCESQWCGITRIQFLNYLQGQQCFNSELYLTVLQSSFCNQPPLLRFSKIPSGKKRRWQWHPAPHIIREFLCQPSLPFSTLSAIDNLPANSAPTPELQGNIPSQKNIIFFTKASPYPRSSMTPCTQLYQ